MRASVSMPEGWGNTRAAADARRALSQLRTLILPVCRWLARHVDLLAALSVVIVSAVLHAVNLFSFPYYQTYLLSVLPNRRGHLRRPGLGDPATRRARARHLLVRSRPVRLDSGRGLDGREPGLLHLRDAD